MFRRKKVKFTYYVHLYPLRLVKTKLEISLGP
nr:MAG TPA: hypothetical protein [Caudoviricetes sp.]